MHFIAAAVGSLLVLFVLWDAFETIVLPRRVSRRFRLTRFFYAMTWRPWRAMARRKPEGNIRENFLSIFGPLSLLMLLTAWAIVLLFAFTLLHWGVGTRLAMPAGLSGFEADLYYSATTLVSLGLGDVTPASGSARVLTFLEGGIGFAFLALVIGYLPTLFQAFTRREVSVALLDARAGSPPTASELIRRLSGESAGHDLGGILHDWDVWSADLLETQVSFPVLAYYRSQHDNQSWLAGMTTMLDVCALVIAGVEKCPVRPARLAFAMGRHALADLAQIFHLAPSPPASDRLPEADSMRLRETMRKAGLPMKEGSETLERLNRLRAMYEPYAHALSRHLLMPLPPWVPPLGARDNWQTLA